MTPEYNEHVLATAYHSGWLTDEQFHAATAALQAMPHLSAIDFLLEQAIISAGQAEGLRQALTPPVPAVEIAAIQADGAIDQPRVHAEAAAEPHAHGDLPDGLAPPNFCVPVLKRVVSPFPRGRRRPSP